MKIEKLKFVPKNWGWELHLANSPLYCGKILFVLKNKFSSWHFHLIKTETFFCSEGKIKLLYSNDDDINKAESIILEAGDAFHIPQKLRHRFIGLQDSRIIEISTQHLDNDSFRIQESCPLD